MDERPVHGGDEARHRPSGVQTPGLANVLADMIISALSGQMEIGIGDGSNRLLDPGDILQVEDVTGQGHTTRSVGDRVSASVPLPG
jgi:hypothetical protein